jgi:hypothetical protein
MRDIDRRQRHPIGQIDSQPVIFPELDTGFPETQTGSDGCLARETKMEEFVHSENLKLYRKLLAETTDEQKRQTLLKLLADEEAKDARPHEKKQG